jgi:hypothetical protein
MSSATSRRRPWICLALIAALASAGCVSKRPPVREDLAAREPKRPVVLIPGITGTKLRDPATDRLRWGTSKNLFFPRDGGYSLAVPLDRGAAAGSELQVDGVVLQIRLLGLLKFEFYAPLIRLMEANGYRFGDLDDPRPGDTFFIFPYDWRYGNVRASAELLRKLQNLRRVREEPRLAVDLVCQSNAARIARYFIKYGGADLDAAEAGAPPPADVVVEKLILVGTDNGGALGVLAELNRGRRYLPLLGRRIRPEALFAYASLYESLPVYREDLFFDTEGRTLEVDLFDPQSWERYDWGVYGPGVERRLAKKPDEELFGTEEERAAFLDRALDRALRLQHLLERDVEPFRTRYYSVQNDRKATEDRALLVQKNGDWQTRFARDGRIKRDGRLKALARAPGDTHATVRSQLWLSPQEKAAMVHPPALVRDVHRRIVRHPSTQQHIVDYLAE